MSDGHQSKHSRVWFQCLAVCSSVVWGGTGCKLPNTSSCAAFCMPPACPDRASSVRCPFVRRKLRREIVEKEAAACAERQAAGSHKPIERSKLEANIKEFVRLSIRRLHTARPGGGGAPGGHDPGGMNGV